MLEYRVFLKVESEDASVMLTQYYRGVFITCTLKQVFEKVKECTRVSSGTVDFGA